MLELLIGLIVMVVWALLLYHHKTLAQVLSRIGLAAVGSFLFLVAGISVITSGLLEAGYTEDALRFAKEFSLWAYVWGATIGVPYLVLWGTALLGSAVESFIKWETQNEKRKHQPARSDQPDYITSYAPGYIVLGYRLSDTSSKEDLYKLEMASATEGIIQAQKEMK